MQQKILLEFCYFFSPTGILAEQQRYNQEQFVRFRLIIFQQNAGLTDYVRCLLLVAQQKVNKVYQQIQTKGYSTKPLYICYIIG